MKLVNEVHRILWICSYFYFQDIKVEVLKEEEEEQCDVKSEIAYTDCLDEVCECFYYCYAWL